MLMRDVHPVLDFCGWSWLSIVLRNIPLIILLVISPIVKVPGPVCIIIVRRRSVWPGVIIKLRPSIIVVVELLLPLIVPIAVLIVWISSVLLSVLLVIIIPVVVILSIKVSLIVK